jgi:hypothetical protein
MERNLVLVILALSLLVTGIALLAPGGRPPDLDPKLPWRITPELDGSSRIFGMTLGRSTLAQARQVLADPGEITLFIAKDGTPTLEAYFERVALSGLRADMVLGLGLPRATLEAMYDRGTRASRLGSGELKVTLSGEDAQRVAAAVVRSITYLPVADVPPEVLTKRFGKPAERITGEGGVEHWLYPGWGLDIAVSPDHREVLQYVPPKDFQRLVEGPLRGASLRH